MSHFYSILLKFCCVTFVFLISSLWSLDGFAHLKKTNIPISEVSVLEDQNGTLNIADVLQAENSQWQALAPSLENINMGYSDSTYWLKVVIDQPKNDCCILTVAYTPLDYLDFYQLIDDARLEHQQSGDRYPFSVRPFHDRNNTFRVVLNPDRPTVFYLRAQSESVLKLPLELYSDIEFAQTLGQENFFVGLFYGGLLLIAAYNAFVFFRLRDKVYAYYLFFVISAAHSAACWDGLAFHYLWPNSPHWASKSIPISTGLLTFCTLLFSQELLQTRKNLPWINAIIELMKVAALSLIVLTYLVPYSTVGKMSIFIAYGYGIIGLVIGVASMHRKVEGSGLYLFAWSLLFVGVISNTAANIGILHSNMFTSHLIHVGGVVEVCLFSVALANRIKSLKQAKLDAETRMSVERQMAQDKANTLAVISHELRTPMNAVLGFVYLAKQGKGQLSTMDYLTKIEQASSNLVQLINDSLDFSKLEQKKLSLKSETFSLVDVVDHVASVSTPALAGKPVQMYIQVAPDVPSHIRGDRVRLEQVIINLTSNAIKHTETGYVGLAISVIRQAGHEVVLAFNISDSGSGISQQYQDKLFKPYSQLEDHHKGTGLGLSISQKIVHLMGGNIECVSEVGRGSLFSFDLSFPLVSQPANNSDGAHILLVCEDETFGESAKLTLRWLGMECDLVTASQALEMTCNYDLILVDHALKGISGETFIDILRATDFSHIPVAILCDIDDIEGSESQVEHLSKPIRVGDVFHLVNKVHGKEVSEPETSSFADYALSGLKVLVADDNKLNQEFISDMLTMFGADTDIVENGRQALEAMKKHNYDVLLLDLHMPEVDGIECAMTIRQTPELQQIPIFCTSASPGIVSQHMDVFDDCIAKPIIASRLLKLLTPLATQELSPHALPKKGQIRWLADKSLPEIEGINMSFLYEQCAYSETKVEGKLDAFVAMTEEFLTALNQTSESDYREKQRLYHDFAGTAGAIGAKDIQELALELDLAWQNEQPDESVAAELEEKTRALLNRIHAVPISSTVV